MLRNKKYKSAIPNIDSDGEFIKPISVVKNLKKNDNWHAGLKPWQRLNLHQTYSSVRRHVNFMPFRVMNDHLDLVLNTNYQHNEESFPEPIDIYFQPITIYGEKKYLEEKSKTKQYYKFGKYGKPQVEPKTFKEIKKFVLAHKKFPHHPLIVGGVKQRVHPSSVKLMNSSHHSPQTNAGYMRQDRDGMIFYY